MLLGLLFFFIVFFAGLAAVEFRILLTMRDKINDALTGAELAALGTADRDKLGYGIVELPLNEAGAAFESYLAANLQGVAVEPPVIEEFIVFNPGDYPALCPRGSLIEETAVHAVISVTVERPLFKGLFGERAVFTIHKDSDDIFH